MGKEYFCELHNMWVNEHLVEIETNTVGKPTYINFNLPQEPCQLYYETEIRGIEQSIHWRDNALVMSLGYLGEG